MEVLFEQKLNYAGIITFKNYSTIEKKDYYANNRDSYFNMNERGIAIAEFVDNTDSQDFPKFACKPLFLKPKNKRNTSYFYSEDENINEFFIYRKFPNKNCYHTTKDRQIKKHINNPFSEIWTSTLIRKIKKDGDKVKLIYMRFHKHREINSKYFKKYREIKVLTVNTRTGNFYFTDMKISAKSRNQKFKQNDFQELKNFEHYTVGTTIPTDIKNNKQYEETFSHDAFLSKAIETLGFKKYDNFTLTLFENIIKLKKIKVPNSYLDLLIHLYPTEKYLKRNDRKLIASALDMIYIKSKVTIKLLHKYPNISINVLFNICCFFNKDFANYLSRIKNVNLLCKFPNEKMRSDDFPSKYDAMDKMKSYEDILTHYEKENLLCIINEIGSLIKIYNLVPSYTRMNRINNDFIILIADHFRIIKGLRKYLPKIQLRAKNLHDFMVEHQEYSKMHELIMKGVFITYNFNKETIDEIEQKLTFEDEFNQTHEYYPLILKNGNDYIEEGHYMHHCVNTYVDKEESVIISIRTGNKDRITCEFDSETGELLQARHFHNGPCPNHYEKCLDKIKQKVKRLARFKLLKPIEKKTMNILFENGEILKKSELNEHEPLTIPF